MGKINKASGHLWTEANETLYPSIATFGEEGVQGNGSLIPQKGLWVTDVNMGYDTWQDNKRSKYVELNMFRHE